MIVMCVVTGYYMAARLAIAEVIIETVLAVGVTVMLSIGVTLFNDSIATVAS